MRSLLLLMLLFGGVSAHAAPKTLEQVLEERLSTATTFTNDLDTVAARNRIRAWLPTSPQVTYYNNDNYSWKAVSLSTSLPIPFKSLYRDELEVKRRGFLQAQNSYTRQELLRETIEIYLECAVPTEMAKLLTQASGDQQVVSSISNSLYVRARFPRPIAWPPKFCNASSKRRFASKWIRRSTRARVGRSGRMRETSNPIRVTVFPTTLKMSF